MKRIISYSKKRIVKNVTDIINNSKILKDNIPELKLHNKVYDKENNDFNRVYLTMDDIKEHSINPKKIEYKLKLEEEHNKRYYRKCSEYKSNIELYDDLNLNGTYKEKTMKINEYFVDKINNTKLNGLECKCIYNEIERVIEKYNSLKIENGTLKYMIRLGLRTREYKDDYYIDFYYLYTMINIYIIKPNEIEHHNHIEMYLQDKFNINIYLYL